MNTPEIEDVNPGEMNQDAGLENMKHIIISERKRMLQLFLDWMTPKRLYSGCRGVAQLVAHRVWDAGVGGSSPLTPTGTQVTRISKTIDDEKKQS
jgi:hypothetical protein